MPTTKSRKTTTKVKTKGSEKRVRRATATRSSGNAVEASLLRAAGEARAFVRGDHGEARVTKVLTARRATVREAPVVTPSTVRSLRAEHRLSQDLFARVLGVSPETLRGWEQGKKRPSGPAVRLLQIAKEYPGWVKDQIKERSAAVV